MTTKERLLNLAQLIDAPIEELSALISAPFDGDDIDDECIKSHYDAYATLSQPTYSDVVKERIQEETPALLPQLEKLYSTLRSLNLTPSEIDLATYIKTIPLIDNTSASIMESFDDDTDIDTVTAEDLHAGPSDDLATLSTDDTTAVSSSSGAETPLVPDSSAIRDDVHNPDVIDDDLDPDDGTVLSDLSTQEVRLKTALVMRVYKELYKTVFDPLPPKGAYSADRSHGALGAIKHHTGKVDREGNDSIISPSSAALDRITALYEALLGSASLIETSKVSAKDLGARYGYYYSTLAGRFASGAIKSPGRRLQGRNKFESALRVWVEKKLRAVATAYADKNQDVQRKAIETAAKNLATSFVVAEFDPDVACLLVLKVCAPGIQLATNAGALQLALRAKSFSGVEIRGVFPAEDASPDFPVYSIAVALNSQVERSAPLYTYQVWDALAASGDLTETVGTHNVVFGRRQDGALQTFNMAKAGGHRFHNMSAYAGTGSGKGLTTLNIVASAAAHGEPVFYLDCKPEMSTMLQDYMQSVGQVGRVFSYDVLGLAGKRRIPAAGSDDARFRHYELPHSLAEKSGVGEETLFGGLIFAKAATLLLAMMRFATFNEADRLNALGYDLNNGALIVFDELEKTETQFDPLVQLCMSNITKETEGAGADKRLTARAQYAEKLQKLCNEIMRAISEINNAVTRFTPISTLALYQTLGYVSGAKKPNRLTNLFGNSALIGRPERGLAKASMVDDIPAEVKLALDARQWCVVPDPPRSVDMSKLREPVKPLLVFNTADDVTKYFNNDEVFRELPEAYRSEVQQNTDRMHLTGLLKAFGVDLSASLSMGYDMAQSFLHYAGFDGTVDDYVLSAQEETLITCSELYARAVEGYENSRASSPDLASDAYRDDIIDSSPTIQFTEHTPTPDPSSAIPPPSNVFDDDDFDTLPQPQQPHNAPLQPPAPSLHNFTAPPVQPPIQPPTQSKSRPIYRFEGRQFYSDEDGNLIPADGRYAPPDNYEKGVYNGQRYTSQPVMEFSGESFDVGASGTVRLSGDTSRYADYGRVLDDSGAVVGALNPRRPLTPEMPTRKLEKEIASRWRALLRLGARQVGGMVVRVSIGENFFSVNDTPVYVENISGDSGLRLIDLVDFADMFALYKGLTTLSLDISARFRFGIAYSKPYMPFMKNPRLEVIYFMGDNNQMVPYDRNAAAQQAGLAPDQLTSRINTWSEFTAQVNRGSSSALCKPGNRLMMADFTKRMASGTFGSNGNWNRPRRALGFIGMLFGAGATVVTGGIQAARSVRRK
jgi:hypothetical protein